MIPDLVSGSFYIHKIEGQIVQILNSDGGNFKKCKHFKCVTHKIDLFGLP